MKRFLSTMLSLAMMATMSTAAFAADTEHTANQVWDADGSLNTASSKMTMEVIKAEDVLIATVPAELPFVVDTKGNLTVPTNAKVVNSSDKPIQVKKIDISGASTNDKRIYLVSQQWFNEYGRDVTGIASSYRIKSMRLSINNVDVALTSSSDYSSNGTIDMSGSKQIPKGGELSLTIKAEVSKNVYANAASAEQFASAIFTIGFAE